MGSRARWLGICCFVIGVASALWFMRGERAADAVGLTLSEHRSSSEPRPDATLESRAGQGRAGEGRPDRLDSDGSQEPEQVAAAVEAAPEPEPEPGPAMVLRVVVETTSGRSLREVLEEDYRPFGFELHVIATAEPPPALMPALTHEGWGLAQGSRELGPAFEGDMARRCALLLPSPPPVYVSLVLGQGVVATRFAPEGTEELRLTLSDADLVGCYGSFELRYQHEDPTRKPQGRVYVENGHWGSFSDSMPKDGRIRRERILPGRVRVQLHNYGRGDWVPWEHTFEVAPGEHVDLGTVTLRDGTPITGRVVLEGAGHAGVTLEIRAEDAEDGPMAWRSGGSSNEDGSFRIAREPPGRYLLRPALSYTISPTGENRTLVGPVRRVDTRGGTLSVVIPLADAVIVDLPRLTSSSQARLYRIVDATGVTVRASSLVAHHTTQHLAPGPYVVVFLTGAGELSRRAFAAAGDRLDLGGAP